MDVINIKTSELKPNEYNPNVVSEDIMAKLRAEIARKGLCVPIVVRSRDNAYEIVDGEHRWRICQELGWGEVPCVIQDYDDNEARIKTLQLNYMKGSVIPIKLANLIHDLNREIKIEELEKMLPYEKIEIKDSLELLKLSENFENGVKVNTEDEEEPRVVWTVVLRKEEAETVDTAIEEIKKHLPQEVKNSKALALEMLCRYFLLDKGVKGYEMVDKENILDKFDQNGEH